AKRGHGGSVFIFRVNLPAPSTACRRRRRRCVHGRGLFELPCAFRGGGGYLGLCGFQPSRGLRPQITSPSDSPAHLLPVPLRLIPSDMGGVQCLPRRAPLRWIFSGCCHACCSPTV